MIHLRTFLDTDISLLTDDSLEGVFEDIGSLEDISIFVNASFSLGSHGSSVELKYTPKFIRQSNSVYLLLLTGQHFLHRPLY